MEIVGDYVFESIEKNWRVMPIEEGMIFEIKDKGFFGFYDELVYKVVPIINELDGIVFTSHQKTNTFYKYHEFNDYISNK